MATRQASVGIDHPTVVPRRNEPDDEDGLDLDSVEARWAELIQ